MTISILILLALVGAMPVLAQPNSGAVRVLVRDHAEAVLPGVRIVLDGPIHRESATDRDGATLIEGLPVGTYQLALTLPGFIDVRVNIDVGANSTASHQFHLRLAPYVTRDSIKPVRETVTTGCRAGDPPRNLADLVKQVDAVAHVRVLAQRGEDRLPPQANRSVLITRNTVDILAVFKAHRRWPAVGKRGEVLQQGGDLDRGDYIEVSRQICLDPLFVGREYVLFLERSEWLGGWGVFFDGEGALLIDGPRVDPLGGGEFAQRWRSEAVADLFAALAKLRL